jgi:hypothetical protein
MATYTPKLKEILRAHGCYFERPGRGVKPPPRRTEQKRLPGNKTLRWPRLIASSAAGRVKLREEYVHNRPERARP